MLFFFFKQDGFPYINIRFYSCTPEPPDPPVDVEVHNPTAEAMTITWKPPLYDGGSKIMGYIIEKIAKGEERWKRCNEHLVPVLTYTAKGLEEGKEYQFRVRAENAAGIGEPSRATPPTKAVDPVGKSCLLGLLSSHHERNENNVLSDRASQVAQMVKCLPAMWETQVQSLGQEDPLEKGMITRSSILAW